MISGVVHGGGQKPIGNFLPVKKPQGLLRLYCRRINRHPVLLRQLRQAVNHLVRRTFRAGFAGGHITDRRLLETDRRSNLGLGEPSSLEL